MNCARRTSHVRSCNVPIALRFTACLYLATATTSCDIIASRHFTGYTAFALPIAPSDEITKQYVARSFDKSKLDLFIFKNLEFSFMFLLRFRIGNCSSYSCSFINLYCATSKSRTSSEPSNLLFCNSPLTRIQLVAPGYNTVGQLVCVRQR